MAKSGFCLPENYHFEPKNHPMEKEHHLNQIRSWVQNVNLPGVYFPQKCGHES